MSQPSTFPARSIGSGGIRLALLVVALATLGLVFPRSAPATATWHEGSDISPQTENCLQQTEQLGMAWVGWYGDLGVSPQANQRYYVKVGWGVTGNPCPSGGAQVHPEISLPPGTQLAITSEYPVRCYLQRSGQTSWNRFFDDCPQSPGNGMQASYSFDPPGGQGAWPTATGAGVEIQIPVKSTNGLDGLMGNPCGSCLEGAIWMIDGHQSPWFHPRIPVYVSGGAASDPYVDYPVPATTNIYYSSGDNMAYADLNGNVFTQGTTGAAYFEIGSAKGDYPVKGNDIAITSPDNWWIKQTGVQMAPGYTYHWRACYKPSGATKVCGADESFQAPPDTLIGDSRIKRSKHKAIFEFASPTAGMRFQCRLDDSRFRSCTSPKTYKQLARGRHTFKVRATDQVGNKDRTPAKQRFRI